MKKNLTLIFTLFFSIYGLCAQNRTIKGKVISEFLETLPNVSIIINDSIEIGETDFDGVFKIELPLYMKKISFRFVGLEPTIIDITSKCVEIEVVLMSSGTYDLMTLKKADRLRMKRFKKLPSLHKEAFDKGLFNTEKACYSREFISYYSDVWN